MNYWCCFWICLCFYINGVCLSYEQLQKDSQVVLLDTHETEWKSWSANPETKGWQSQNVPTTGKIVYGICNQKPLVANNWLISPPITGYASPNLNIDLQYQIRSCARHSNSASQPKHCEDTFGLYKYESESVENGAPSWSLKLLELKFLKVTTVVPEKLWSNIKTLTYSFVNNQTFTLKSRKPVILLAFKDSGACLAIKRVRVYYLVCPRLVQNLFILPKTAAPYGFDVTDVEGFCVKNAGLKTRDKMGNTVCKSDGEWHIGNNARCFCDSGFEERVETASCIACKVNSYKSNSHNMSICLPCPSHSSSDVAAKYCSCEAGYFRNIHKETILDGCSKPPGSPVNLKFSRNDGAVVILEWDSPILDEINLDLDDIVYVLQCNGCSSDISVLPDVTTSQRSFKIIGLIPDMKYEFSVSSINALSSMLSEEDRKKELNTATISLHNKPAVPYKLRNINIQQSYENPHLVNITWRIDSLEFISSHKEAGSMLIDVMTPILEFMIQIIERVDKNTNVTHYFFTTTNMYRVKQFTSGLRCHLRIKGRTSVGWLEYSDVLTFYSGLMSNNGGNDLEINMPRVKFYEKPLFLILVLTGVVIFVFCAIFGLGVIIVRRLHIIKFLRLKLGMSNKDCYHMNSLPYGKVYTNSTDISHVDCYSYIDPMALAINETNEINASFVHVEMILYEGQFKNCYVGSLSTFLGGKELIAVSMLKTTATKRQKINMLSEAQTLCKFNHPNIMKVFGVVTKTLPAAVVMEMLQNGPVDKFLANNKDNLSLSQLLYMINDIAMALQYLQKMNYIVKILAARNVFVASNLQCKLAKLSIPGATDDSLINHVDDSIEMNQSVIRWCSPEVLNGRKFSLQSDIWSFGVFVWEVLSYGEIPFTNWSNQNIISTVRTGYVLQKPISCPDDIYRILIVDCCNKKKSARLKIDRIVDYLTSILNSLTVVSV